MLPQWIIEKKRDGRELTAEEIVFFIQGYTRGDIPDYQMAALAMAIYFRGMTPDETVVLTEAMMRSGIVLDTSGIPKPKADKHSTGGIGDKISLPLAPMLACAGVAVPMLSGRGLGITGGTLDKLEAIPGYRTRLSENEFLDIVCRCGCSIAGPTERLAPADRKLYALRDVTGTVPSIPLITASILSKKLAEGVEHLVFDVKFGAGAFMRTRADARHLADSLVRVGRAMGRNVRALLTDMNQPLGRTVGNALEVAESAEILHGRGSPETVELTLALGAELLTMAGVAADADAARRVLVRGIETGAAAEKFAEMIRLHGGDGEVVSDYNRLPAAAIRKPLVAPGAGYIVGVDAERVGRACTWLGAGRRRVEDTVDPAVGISDLVKVGERVEKGDLLATVHANDPARLEEALKLLREAFTLGEAAPAPGPLVAERVA